MSLWKKNNKNRPGSTLKLYRKIKPRIRKESYLNGPMTGMQRAMARIRISGHGLPSETLKWAKITYKNRLCPQCDRNQIRNVLQMFQYPDNDKFRLPYMKPLTSQKQLSVTLWRVGEWRVQRRVASLTASGELSTLT